MSASTLTRGSSKGAKGGDVDPRIEARRREVERDHGRRRRSRVVGFAIVAASITVIVGLVQSPLLDIDRVDVASTDHVSVDEITRVSGVTLHRPLALVDAEAVRAKLLQLPWVADASVTAKWPGTLRLAVTERVPVAMAAVPEGGFVLLDNEGRVLGPATSPPAPDLTGPALIEGLVVPAPGNLVDARGQTALEVLAAIPSGVRTRVEAIVIDPDGEVTLRLRPDMVATIGPIANLDQKIRTLQTTLAQVQLDDIESIDLRVAGRADVTRRTTVLVGGVVASNGSEASQTAAATTQNGAGTTPSSDTSGSAGASGGSASPSKPR